MTKTKKPTFPAFGYDFERWMNRPVHIAQVFTFDVCKRLHPDWSPYFRALRAFRSAEESAVRNGQPKDAVYCRYTTRSSDKPEWIVCDNYEQLKTFNFIYDPATHEWFARSWATGIDSAITQKDAEEYAASWFDGR